MTLDGLAPPKSLISLTAWFAKAISSPFGDIEGKEAAPEYVTPGPFLTSEERLFVYHEQYWLRLLNALSLDYPAVVRLFGRMNFERYLAVPYLLSFPPNHWSLSELGGHFVSWLSENYTESDLPLVRAIAELDRADLDVSIAAKSQSTFAHEAVDELLDAVFERADHVRLFHFDRDFVRFRAILLDKEEDGWLDEDFPSLGEKRDYYFIFYRSKDRRIWWEELQEPEWSALSSIKGPMTLNDFIESHQDEEAFEKNIPFWLQRWVFLGWLNFR